MKPEIDWLEEDPAADSCFRFKSEDYVCFIRAIRLELLDHIYSLAENKTTSKSEFLVELSKLYREWKIIKL